ncbi:MAG: GNAT family N-acetyltransferase [Bacteroidaceae bacterium]|nr:GNAT family N-acetyltransferase [Bacteroidaceae bacterium]
MNEYNDDIEIVVADASYEKYVDIILQTIADSAAKRGSGIATRTHEYLATKMKECKAVIALAGPEKEFAGFCYIESWGNKAYVANSGLIVVEKFRKHHLATRIKMMAFTLSRLRWPHAKIFGLTSQTAVMRINHALGYRPVAFSELTDDDAFWRGCGTPGHPCCVNFDVLQRSDRRYCVCTGMLYDPAEHEGEPLPLQLPDEVVQKIKKMAELESKTN